MAISTDVKQEKILVALRLVAPEFANRPQDELKLMISFAKAQVSESVFGDAYPMAVALLTAHLFSTAVSSSGSSSDDGSPSAPVDSAARGPLLSESEGGISRSYGSPSVTSTGGGKTSSLSNTSYGAAFLELKNSFVLAPLLSGRIHAAPYPIRGRE